VALFDVSFICYCRFTPMFYVNCKMFKLNHIIPSHCTDPIIILLHNDPLLRWFMFITKWFDVRLEVYTHTHTPVIAPFIMHHLIGKRSFTRLLSRDHTRFYLPPACLSASPNETAAPAFSSSFTPIRQKGEQHLQHAFSHKAMRCGVSIGVTPNARVGLVMRCQ